MNPWALVLRHIEAGGACALVSVVRTHGSAPRDAGAHMVVTAAGYHGSIGGGTLEWRAIAAAQALLGRGLAANAASYALGPDLGQCCGGRVDLLTEVFDRSSLAEVSDLAAREAEGPFAVVRHGMTLSFGEARRRVYVFGAGHVGRALIMALAPLPFSVVWLDPRPDAFPSMVPGNVETVAAADPSIRLSDAPGGSLAFIMSHSHALDLAIAAAALRHPAIAAVGLIGSATKRTRFEKRLIDAGVGPERVAGLICPIGVPGISDKHPAAIAAATAAQILVLDEQLRLATPAVQPQHAEKRTGAGR